MWGKKFGYVVGEAIAFPFKKMSKVFGLYFFTALFVGGVMAVTVTIGGGLEQHILQNPDVSIMSLGREYIIGTFKESYRSMNLGLGFLLFIAMALSYLAYLPFAAGVIRAAITDKHVDPNIMKAVFTTTRPWSFFWAEIKIIASGILVVMIGSLLGAIISIPFFYAFGGSVGGFIIGLFFVISLILAIVVIVRLSFAPVLAALDKGTSLGESWRLSSGNWWLIFLSVAVISIIITIAEWSIMMIGGFILGGMAMLLGAIMIPIGVILYSMLGTYLMIPHLAALGYLYLVVTGKAKLPAGKK